MKVYKKDKRNFYLFINAILFYVIVILSVFMFSSQEQREASELSDLTVAVILLLIVVLGAISLVLYMKDYLPNWAKAYFHKKNKKMHFNFQTNEIDNPVNIHEDKTYFDNFFEQSVKLHIYKCINLRYIINDFENYYDYENEKYFFTNYTLVRIYDVNPGETLTINKDLENIDKHLTDNELIVFLEYNGIYMEAQGVQRSHDSSIQMIIPGLKEINEVSIELKNKRDEINKNKKIEEYNNKILEEEKATLLKNKLKNQRELEEIAKNLRERKLFAFGLSQHEINKVNSFYDRKLYDKNIILDKYGFSDINFNSGMIKDEFVLELYLDKNKYLYCFNPLDEQDKYTIDSSEMSLLNRLGMVSQSTLYPNLVKVRDIRIESNLNLIGLSKEINIIYPNFNIDKSIKNGFEFEQFVSELLLLNEFYNVEVTSSSGDQGVDIVAETSDGVRYGFQTKFYTSSVGNDAVQQIIAGKKFYNLDVGVVLTNSTFTSSAITLAETDRILLWDKDKLHQLMKAL